MNMTTLRDISFTSPVPELLTSFEHARGAVNRRIPPKSWAKDYQDAQVEAIKNPSLADMAALLGPEDELDQYLLGMPMHPLNPNDPVI